MSTYQSREELIRLIGIYNTKEDIEYYFLEWLNTYSGFLHLVTDYQYSILFEDAIKKHMPDILRYIITNKEFELIELLRHKYQKEIFENINVIFKEDSNYKIHYPDLVSLDGFEACSLKNQELILNCALNDTENTFDDLTELVFLLSALPFFGEDFALNNSDKIVQFISKHFPNINPQKNPKDAAFLLKAIAFSSQKHAFIENYFLEHLEFIVTILTNRELEELKKEKILDFYVELIKDVMRIEKATIGDMNINNGAFSRVLIIKDKVIKSGKKNTKKIPYHKRLLQPIVKQTIKSLDNDEDFDYIEVYERTDDIPWSFNNKEIIYPIFKEMLEDGVLCGDPSLDNFGKLIKPNKIYYDAETEGEFIANLESVDLYGVPDYNQVLGEGDLVIRDLDIAYDLSAYNLRSLILEKISKNESVSSQFIYQFVDNKKNKIGPELETYFKMYVEDLKKEYFDGIHKL